VPRLYEKTLDYITVKGFRSIECIEKLELGWLNVLIGANGAGKSNFVQVFELLRALRRGQLQLFTEKAGGAEILLHLGSKVANRLEIDLSFRGETNGYHITLAPTDADDFSIQAEWVRYWQKNEFRSPKRVPVARKAGGEAGISGELKGDKPTMAGWIQEDLDSWIVYHFHDTSASSPMKKNRSGRRQPKAASGWLQSGSLSLPVARHEARRVRDDSRHGTQGGAIFPRFRAGAPAPQPLQDQARVAAQIL
jgi:predicted ATPase